MPTISFIVPVYNVEDYLPRCLDSLLNQTFPDYEILAVNDGSRDSCPEILKEYEKKSPRIRVFHKENGGLSDARNYGLERAEGEFISFVDSDDFLHPEYGKKMVEKMQKEELDLLFCDYFYYYDSEKTVPASARKHLSRDVTKEALLAAPMAWLRMYRKSILEEVRFVKGLYYEDLEMTPGMILKTRKIGFLEEALYYYRQREGSIMRQSRFSPKFLDIFKVTDSIYSRFDKAGKLEEYKDEIEFLFLEHLYRSAALRFAPLNEGGELFLKLRRSVEDRFPEWKKNPYLPRVSLFFRLSVYFTGMGWRFAVKILSRLKG